MAKVKRNIDMGKETAEEEYAEQRSEASSMKSKKETSSCPLCGSSKVCQHEKVSFKQ